jgi:hypothetical protein
MTMQSVPCFGCGGTFPDREGPTHRYMESSPGCWTVYGEVLGREYSDREYGILNRLTVDAYAVQHPGRRKRQAVQSVALHLISLCLILERGKSVDDATRAIHLGAARKNYFAWLEPPNSMGPVTVADIQHAQAAHDHLVLVKNWAKSAWLAWAPHHATVHAWADELTGRRGPALQWMQGAKQTEAKAKK